VNSKVVNTTYRMQGCMPARKVRVELFDTEGNRYSISFEGQVTREKALRLLDMVELLGGMPGESGNHGSASVTSSDELSKYDKVRAIVQRHFPAVWFRSHEVQSVYEQELKEPITLSTVATYLSRMASKGVILRSGPRNSLRYRVVQGVPQVAVKVSHDMANV
jgi:hypothetical protein